MYPTCIRYTDIAMAHDAATKHGTWCSAVQHCVANQPQPVIYTNKVYSII